MAFWLPVTGVGVVCGGGRGRQGGGGGVVVAASEHVPAVNHRRLSPATGGNAAMLFLLGNSLPSNLWVSAETWKRRRAQTTLTCGPIINETKRRETALCAVLVAAGGQERSPQKGFCFESAGMQEDIAPNSYFIYIHTPWRCDLESGVWTADVLIYSRRCGLTLRSWRA